MFYILPISAFLGLFLALICIGVFADLNEKKNTWYWTKDSFKLAVGVSVGIIAGWILFQL